MRPTWDLGVDCERRVLPLTMIAEQRGSRIFQATDLARTKDRLVPRTRFASRARCVSRTRFASQQASTTIKADASCVGRGVDPGDAFCRMTTIAESRASRTFSARLATGVPHGTPTGELRCAGKI